MRVPVEVTVLISMVTLVGMVTFVGMLFGGQEREGLGDVERPIRGDLGDGLVEGGLEAGDVEDEVCLADLGDLLRAELEVMRLAPGGREVDDLHTVAADLLRGVGQRIEARDDA